MASEVNYHFAPQHRDAAASGEQRCSHLASDAPRQDLSGADWSYISNVQGERGGAPSGRTDRPDPSIPSGEWARGTGVSEGPENEQIPNYTAPRWHWKPSKKSGMGVIAKSFVPGEQKLYRGTFV